MTASPRILLRAGVTGVIIRRAVSVIVGSSLRSLARIEILAIRNRAFWDALLGDQDIPGLISRYWQLVRSAPSSAGRHVEVGVGRGRLRVAIFIVRLPSMNSMT